MSIESPKTQTSPETQIRSEVQVSSEHSEYVTLSELAAVLPRMRGGGPVRGASNTLRKYAVFLGIPLFKVPGGSCGTLAMTPENARKMIRNRRSPHLLIFGAPARPVYSWGGQRFFTAAELARAFGILHSSVLRRAAVCKIRERRPARYCRFIHFSEDEATELALHSYQLEDLETWLNEDDLADLRFVFLADAALKLGTEEKVLAQAVLSFGMPIIQPEGAALPRLRLRDYQALLVRFAGRLQKIEEETRAAQEEAERKRYEAFFNYDRHRTVTFTVQVAAMNGDPLSRSGMQALQQELLRRADAMGFEPRMLTRCRAGERSREVLSFTLEESDALVASFAARPFVVIKTKKTSGRTN